MWATRSREVALRLPLTFLVIALVLLLSFRNLQGMAIPMLTAALSTTWGLGFMGHTGSFSGVPDLIAAISEFIDANNDDPQPFVWTASVEKILAKISRCKAIFETVQ